MRREISRLRLLNLRRERPSLCLPGRQSAIENRRPIAQTEIIERHENARRRRHPVLAKVDNNPRFVGYTELLEGGLQLFHRRQFENQPLSAWRRNIGQLNELGAANVGGFVFLFLANL